MPWGLVLGGCRRDLPSSQSITVPKRDPWEERLILDLSKLNKYINYPSLRCLPYKRSNTGCPLKSENEIHWQFTDISLTKSVFHWHNLTAIRVVFQFQNTILLWARDMEIIQLLKIRKLEKKLLKIEFKFQFSLTFTQKNSNFTDTNFFSKIHWQITINYKIHWHFTDLEKYLFFTDFSLTVDTLQN